VASGATGTRIGFNGLFFVWFSRWGTLLDTVAAFVESSAAGCFVEELDNLLHVKTEEPLLRLFQQERVTRQPVNGLYLYCSAKPIPRQRQLLVRRVMEAQPHLAGGLAGPGEAPEELRAASALFFSLLDEKQRRLYAGLESLKLGYGGDVAKGRRELVEQDFEMDRIRKAGGGRKRVEKKRPKSSPESRN
jgi:hypothetical protein